jgi:hypothetical protein
MRDPVQAGGQFRPRQPRVFLKGRDDAQTAAGLFALVVNVKPKAK